MDGKFQGKEKLESADPDEGLHNYLRIKKSTKKIITQEKNHIIRDTLFRIWFTHQNLLSHSNALLTSPIEAHYDNKMRNKKVFNIWQDENTQREIKSLLFSH